MGSQMKHNYVIQRKNKFPVVVAVVLLMIGFGQSMNLHAEQLMVEEKVLVNAPAKAVWALVGGFQILDRWHPGVVASTLLGTGKDIGDIRVLTLDNNLYIVEKLELYDDAAMTLQYQILESPLPVENYYASIIVKEVKNNMTEVVWHSSFNAVGVSNDEAKQTISGVYLAGFNSLTSLFK